MRRFATAGVATVTLAALAACGSSSANSDTGGVSIDDVDRDAATDETLGLSLLTEDQRKLIEGIETTDVARSLDYTVRQSTDDGVQSDTPTELGEVDADGDTHHIVHPGATSPLVPEGGTDQQIESWSDGAWLYLEYTGFADGDPVLDMFNLFPAPGEWLEPGVFKVDVGRVGDELDLTPAEVTQALAGSTRQSLSVPDPFLYYAAIRADGADPDPNDPAMYRVEATFGEIGDELDSLAGMTAPTTTLAKDAEYLAAASRVPVTFNFSIDDEGRIDHLTLEIDYAGLASVDEAASPETVPPVSSQQSSYITTYSVDYGFDDDIEMPSDVTDDRTDAFIEWYSSVKSSMSTPTEETIAPTSSTTG